MVSQLLLSEPAPLAATQDESSSDGSLQTLLTLCDLLNRELLVLIGWAKQIPGQGPFRLRPLSLLQVDLNLSGMRNLRIEDCCFTMLPSC